MDLFDKVKQVNLRPLDIVNLSNGRIKTKMASEWIAKINSKKKISTSIELLIERMCEEKKLGYCFDESITKDDVLEYASNSSDVVGVYFLIKEDDIIYIGKSLTVHSRLHYHRIDKHFDKVFIIKSDKESISNIEKLMIKKFKPKLNFVHNPDISEYFKNERLKNSSAAVDLSINSDLIEIVNCEEYIPGILMMHPTINSITLANYSFIKKGNIIYCKFKDILYKSEMIENLNAIRLDGLVFGGDFNKNFGSIKPLGSYYN